MPSIPVVASTACGRRRILHLQQLTLPARRLQLSAACWRLGLLRAASQRLRTEHHAASRGGGVRRCLSRAANRLRSMSGQRAGAADRRELAPLATRRGWRFTVLVLVCKLKNPEAGYRATRRLERKRSAPMSSSMLPAASGGSGERGATPRRQLHRERKEGVACQRPGGTPGLRRQSVQKSHRSDLVGGVGGNGDTTGRATPGSGRRRVAHLPQAAAARHLP